MFSRYLAVSLLALALDYSLLLGTVSRLQMREATAAAISYLAGAVLHYVLSRLWVFPAGWLRRRPAVEFVAFFASGLVGAALTTGIVYAATELMHLSLVFSKTVAVFGSYFVTYGLRRAAVFRSADGVRGYRS